MVQHLVNVFPSSLHSLCPMWVQSGISICPFVWLTFKSIISASEISVVNSVGGSFCWNYATDTFFSNYAGANVQLCRFWGSVTFMLVILSATIMLLDLFVAITQVGVSVVIMQLDVSAAFIQVKVSAANMWVTIFIEIIQESLFQPCR